MENVLLMTFELGAVNIQAGTETTARLDLRNWGECRMTYRLLSGCVPEQWIEIDPNQVRVNPGGEVAITIRIKVPADARVAQRTLVIHAIDPFTELECGHAMLKLQANASQTSPSPLNQIPFVQAPDVDKPATAPTAGVQKLVLSVAPASQSRTGSAVYSLSVTNPYSHSIELYLEARDESNQLALVVDPSYLVLGPHQAGTARVQVTPIRPLPERIIERPCTFVVSAHTTDGTVGSTQGTLLQIRPPSSAPAWVWIGSASGAIVLLLLCFVLTNVLTVQGIPPAAGGPPAPAVPVPVNAPPITSSFTATRQPTALPTDSLQATAIPLSPFAITNLDAIADPTTSTKCPTSFSFSAQITANGPGAATYYWEFSDGATTDPTIVRFKQPGEALVQTERTLYQSTNGWGRLHVTSPAELISNQVAFRLICAALPPDATGGSSQPQANPPTSEP